MLYPFVPLTTHREALAVPQMLKLSAGYPHFSSLLSFPPLPIGQGGNAAPRTSAAPCRTTVDVSFTGHAPFAAAHECCAAVYSSRDRCRKKFRIGAIPRGGWCRGKEWG